MSMQQTPAGWYPDPWNTAPLRYWDGTTWTGNTSGTPADNTLGPTGKYSESNVARAAAHGRLAVRLQAIGTAIFPAVGGIACFIVSFFANDIRNGSQASSSSSEAPTWFPAFGAVIFIVAFIGIITLIALQYTSLGFFMAWTYRISENARDLGIKTRFSSGLACCSWIIPYANYVMPYLAIRSAASEADKSDRILRWWLVFLLAPIAAVAVCGMLFFAFFLGPIAGGFAGLLMIAAGIGAAYAEHRFGNDAVRLISERHRAIAAEVGAVGA
ncbi:MAG: DUF4328 domain-containing protein [Acidimicrobiia bacterium]